MCKVDNIAQKYYKEGLAFIFSLVLTMLISLLGNFGNDVYKIEFSSKDLKSAINVIIESNNAYNDKQEFINKNDFSDITKSKLNKLFLKEPDLNDKELMQIYFVIKDKFPSKIELDITRESEKWSRWLYIGIIFLLSYLFAWVFAFLIFSNFDFKTQINKILNDWVLNKENALNKWSENEENNLKGAVDTHFEETIRKFATAHKGFINGMYDNYPHNFTPIFDENSGNFEHLKKGKRSLYIWMNKIGIDTYSDFANDLLNLTRKSVFSTTYYDNNQFIEAIASNSKVISWLDNVNDRNSILKEGGKVNNTDFDVFRVHMFKNKNGAKISSSDFTDFVNSIKNNGIAKKNYIEKYINTSDNFYTWHAEGEIFFYGEYIIFDNQIMIKYDEDFDVLELYIGQIVKEHSNSFKVDGTCFELNKEQMIKKLNDK